MAAWCRFAALDWPADCDVLVGVGDRPSTRSLKRVDGRRRAPESNRELFGRPHVSPCPDVGVFWSVTPIKSFGDGWEQKSHPKFLRFSTATPPQPPTFLPHLLPYLPYLCRPLPPAHLQSISGSLQNFTMGTGKKEKSRLVRQGKTGDGMQNVKVKGENFYR